MTITTRRRWSPVTYRDLHDDAAEADRRAMSGETTRPVGWRAWQHKRLKADARAIRATRERTVR